MRKPVGSLVSNRGPLVVSILSGKGGVGKSVLSAALASQLAKTKAEILLLDADFERPNQPLLHTTHITRGLEQFINGTATLAQVTVPMGPGVALTAVADWKNAPTHTDVAATARFIAALRIAASDYDFVICDHGSGLSHRATVMAHASDINIIVIVPELASLADGYGLYKHLLMVNPEIDCRFLMNRIESAEQAEFLSTNLSVMAQKFLSRTPAFVGAISESPAMKGTVISQLPGGQMDTEQTRLSALQELAQYMVQLRDSRSKSEQFQHEPVVTLSQVTADIER